jgi:hypothetical protein
LNLVRRLPPRSFKVQYSTSREHKSSYDLDTCSTFPVPCRKRRNLNTCDTAPGCESVGRYNSIRVRLSGGVVALTCGGVLIDRMKLNYTQEHIEGMKVALENKTKCMAPKYPVLKFSFQYRIFCSHKSTFPPQAFPAFLGRLLPACLAAQARESKTRQSITPQDPFDRKLNAKTLGQV